MERHHAPFSVRFAAMTIDLMIITLIQIFLGGGTVLVYGYFCDALSVPTSTGLEEILSQFCGLFFFIGYFTFTMSVFGNTVGKAAVKIVVISEETHKVLTPMQAFQRSLGYLISSWTYAIGFLLAYFRQDKKALHDLICNTTVLDRSPVTKSKQLSLPLNYEPASEVKVTSWEDAA